MGLDTVVPLFSTASLPGRTDTARVTVLSNLSVSKACALPTPPYSDTEAGRKGARKWAVGLVQGKPVLVQGGCGSKPRAVP